MKYTLLFLFIHFANCIYSQPQGINYQGVARDASGITLLNQSISIRLSILDSTVSGQAVYIETQNATTNNSGHFNLSIGNGSIVAGVFANIPWGQGDKWLKIEMDATGSSNYMYIGTSQFLSVPFSLYSMNGLPSGSNKGELLYWEDSVWVKVPVGIPGQVLTLNDDSTPTWKTKDLRVGDLYQGGILAYILRPGDPGYSSTVQHGLIAAPFDQSTGIQWYNGTYSSIGLTGTSIGTGNANTNAIVANQGVGNYAARLCYDLILNGYSDWYLPSKDELNKIFENRGAVGGFGFLYYWSSSEHSYPNAWPQYFTNGNQLNQDKGGIFYVRAIRSF